MMSALLDGVERPSDGRGRQQDEEKRNEEREVEGLSVTFSVV